MTIFDLHQDQLLGWAHHAGTATGRSLRHFWHRARVDLVRTRPAERTRRGTLGLGDAARFAVALVVAASLIAILLLLVLGVVAAIYGPAAREALQAMGFPI